MQFFLKYEESSWAKEALRLGIIDGVIIEEENFSSIREQGIHYPLIINSSIELLEPKLQDVAYTIPIQSIRSLQKTENTQLAITSIESPSQFLLAAKAKARYALVDIKDIEKKGNIALPIIDDVCRVIENYPDINTQLIIDSVETLAQLTELAKIGCDAAILNKQLFYKLLGIKQIT